MHPGVAEAGAVFEADMDVRFAIYRQVLERWDYRCAVTGERFPGATPLHEELEVAMIRPQALGGPLHVRNYLPMVTEAAELWLHGNMTVTDSLLLSFVFDRVDPNLLRRIPSGFRLIVPTDPELRPDPAHLAFHRQHVFGAA